MAGCSVSLAAIPTTESGPYRYPAFRITIFVGVPPAFESGCYPLVDGKVRQ